MSSFDLHGIVAGHDGTPVPFTEIVTDDGHYFDPPETAGTYSEGEPAQRGDGSLTLEGMESIEFTWDYWEFPEFRRFLSNNYCDGGLSGPVTVDVSTEDDETLYRFNGMLHLPPPNRVERDRETGWYKNAKARVIDLEFIEEVS